MRLGTGVDGELTMLDIMSIVSFCIGMVNLDENLSQSDKADLQNSLQEELQRVLSEVHQHLATQDDKIDRVLELLEGKKDEGN